MKNANQTMCRAFVGWADWGLLALTFGPVFPAHAQDKPCAVVLMHGKRQNIRTCATLL